MKSKAIPSQTSPKLGSKIRTLLDVLTDDEHEKLWQRFWIKVNKNGPYSKKCRSKCWMWTVHLNEKGYGQFKIKGKFYKPHRVSYELMVGVIPDDLQGDHLCDNTSCVRPSHIEPVTNEENMRRRAARASA